MFAAVFTLFHGGAAAPSPSILPFLLGLLGLSIHRIMYVLFVFVLCCLQLFKVATPIIENNFPETQHATYVLPCNGVIMMAWKVRARREHYLCRDRIRIRNRL